MTGTVDSLIADVAAPKQERADALVDPLVGTQLGNYEIVFVLGKGAYGKVYKARDVKLGRFVAIKFLHEFLDARHEAMFLREAKAIAALGKHPSIVQIFEWSEYQGRNYFVLEFVGSSAGMLLRVNRTGLPVERAVSIALDCAEALAYAHRQNIIHRDIKPANLLLEIEGGRAKLADFGVARLFDPTLGGGKDTPGGTPGYMPPEIISGGEGDARSDIFSLGVTLYELLCGKRPFEGKDLAEVIERTRSGQGTPLRQVIPGLSEPLLRMIDRAIAHDPEKRYPSADALAVDLRAFLNVAHASPTSLSQDAAAMERADVAKTRAFKAAEDAQHAGADKLAHSLLSAGIEAFRDGEAHERLKHYGPAVECYEASHARFRDAEDRANQIMAEIRGLKAAQREMWQTRSDAERADAGNLAADTYNAARKEEEEARKTPALAQAGLRYRKAQSLYAAALAEARGKGEAAFAEPRRQLEKLRREAKAMETDLYAAGETAAAEEYIGAADASIPDYRLALRHCLAAINRYHEAIRVTDEHKRIESETGARPPITIANIDFVWVAPGAFVMGDDEGPEEERPAHQVNVSYGFWIGRYPVTQKQWTQVMGENPSGFQGSEDLPVENVSRDDAQSFIQKLNALGKGTFRLPTEAEWEYACRAGSTQRWCFGDDAAQLGAYAWIPDNAAGRTHPVGQKQPNAWGLYDMHGNVCEWCEDTWHTNYEGAPGDSSAWKDEHPEHYVTRGGSWCILTSECTSTYRAWSAAADDRCDFMGLRLVRNK